MSSRPRNWMERFEAVIAERMFTPFGYGENDCVIFAAECVHACTGRDVWQGQSYTGITDGLRLLRDLGGMAAIAGSRFGDEIKPELAQPGDVGLYVDDDPARPGLTVNVGGAWLAPAALGLQPIQPTKVQTAWRCDRAV